ncbi:MAG: DegV family protein [Clostridiaceae bacterium]
MSYYIVTDSTCDLPLDQLKALNVGRAPLVINFQDGRVLEDGFSELNSHEFFEGMRAGMISTTSQVNSSTFYTLFCEVLTKYDNVLYIGFSSELSGTFQSAFLAKSTLEEEDPAWADRIVLIDSLAASVGEGLLVLDACEKRDAGMGFAELCQYIESIKLLVNHWFTVDDLVYLKRGGRVSSIAATMGTLLNIKPILQVNNKGKLVPISKVKGRKKSLVALVDRFREMYDPAMGKNFILGHGDCKEEALTVKEALLAEFDLNEPTIVPLGMVIGSHAGPGTICLCFLGKPREAFN